MNVVERIIEKFGSQEAVAKAVGVTQPTVSYWKETGFIPARRQEQLLQAARDKQIDLTEADFFQGAA